MHCASDQCGNPMSECAWSSLHPPSVGRPIGVAVFSVLPDFGNRGIKLRQGFGSEWAVLPITPCFADHFPFVTLDLVNLCGVARVTVLCHPRYDIELRHFCLSVSVGTIALTRNDIGRIALCVNEEMHGQAE